MSSEGPSVSVVFPAYNEAEGIVAAIDDALGALGALEAEGVIDWFELLVVDDGSEDGTAGIVEQQARLESSLRLVSHRRNRGVGAGLRTALGIAKGSVVLYTDADMPVDLMVLREALPLLTMPGVGLVAGHRSRYGVESRFREIASRAFDALAARMFGVTVPDVNFPFKLITLDNIMRLDLRSEGALVDVELLAGVARLGLTIAPLGMDYRSRQFGSSKTMSFRLLSKLAVEAVRHRAAIRG